MQKKSNFYLSILKKSQKKKQKNQIFIAQGFEKKYNITKMNKNKKGEGFTLFFLEEKGGSEMEPGAIE